MLAGSLLRNYNFSNENLAILDHYEVIFKMSAAENGKEQNRYFYNWLPLLPNDLGHNIFVVTT